MGSLPMKLLREATNLSEVALRLKQINLYGKAEIAETVCGGRSIRKNLLSPRYGAVGLI